MPGATDLVLETPAGARALAELKILNVDQTLWDLIKLISILDADSTAARAYLITATTARRWGRAEVSELYAAPTNRADRHVREWSVGDLVARWETSWGYLLKGGSGRPRNVPGRVRTTFVSGAHVEAFPGYELRCISVEPVATADRLEFDPGGWPLLGDPWWDDGSVSRFALEGLIEEALRTRDAVASPFAGFWEAPPIVHSLYERHNDGLQEAMRTLRERLDALITDARDRADHA